MRSDQTDPVLLYIAMRTSLAGMVLFKTTGHRLIRLQSAMKREAGRGIPRFCIMAGAEDGKVDHISAHPRITTRAYISS